MKQTSISTKAAKMTAAMILCLLTLLSANAATAQDDLIKSEYSYRRYTINDGLPDIFTKSIFQDSKGFIWVGTLSGFARFDGIEFKSFDSKGRSIVNFLEYNNYIIANGSCKSFCIDDKDSLNMINMVNCNSDGYAHGNSKSLPIGYGIYQIDNKYAVYSVCDTGLVKVWEHEILNRLLMYNYPYWDRPNRRFFIPIVDEGVYVVHENGTIEQHFDIKDITGFIEYRNTIWGVGFNGLYEFKNDNLYQIVKYPFLIGEVPDLQMAVDSDKNLLIRTYSSLYRYCKENIEIITENLIGSKDLFVDSEGNIWIASGKGLINFFKLNFKNFILQPEGSATQSLVLDNQNRLWMPTIDGRLILFENNKEKLVKYPASPSGYSFFETAINYNNLIYLSCGAGLLKYDCNINQFKWMPNLSIDYLAHILFLSNGDLVLDYTNTIKIYNPDKGIIKRIYDMNELRQSVYCVYVDIEDNIWIGGGYGITVINEDSIRYFDDEILNMCTYITCDNNHKIWMICSNRLMSMENDTIKTEYVFTEMKDLCNLYITRNGIMIVTSVDELYLASDLNNLNFIRYDQFNGYNNSFAIARNHIVEDKEGNVYIPTIEKTVCFNPEKLLKTLQPPRLYLQECKSSINNIQWETTDMSNPTLNHRQNNIRFNYIGISFSAAGNVRYHYRLKGFQNEWSEPTKNREVTFNNLPPGDYVFEIYADAGNDDSRSETQSFAFTIKPAFWQTWWFIAISIMTLMLLTAFVAIYYQRRKNAELMQRLSAEKQLNELRIKGIRLKAIPHFNANVLSAIEYYILNRPKEEASRLLGIYSNFTYQTLREVDKASRSLQEELDYVQMYLQLEKLRFTDKFDFDIDIDPNINKEVQLPNMVLHTYCENAIKHAFATFESGGTLKITAKQENNTVHIAVEDNGIGRRAAQSNTQVRSTKQGLDILNRQIEIYNSFNKQKIVQRVVDLVNDGIACGTRFILEVPLGFVYQ